MTAKRTDGGNGTAKVRSTRTRPNANGRRPGSAGSSPSNGPVLVSTEEAPVLPGPNVPAVPSIFEPKSITIGKRTITFVISEVARATGLSVAHVSRVFGNRRTPSLKAARKISQYLRVSIDQLYSALNLQ